MEDRGVARVGEPAPRATVLAGIAFGSAICCPGGNSSSPDAFLGACIIARKPTKHAEEGLAAADGHSRQCRPPLRHRGKLQSRAARRGRFRRRPRQQGRLPGARRGGARAAEGGRRRPARRDADRRNRPQAPRQAARHRRARGGRAHPGRRRGVRKSAGGRDPPLHAPEGVAGRGARRGRRRISREPHRRARHRPRLGDPEERGDRRHARPDPQPSQRGGADRQHPARAALDVLRP